MPGTEMHGFEHKLVFNTVLFHFTKIAKLTLQSATSPTLQEKHDDKRKEQHDADSPQHRDEIFVLCLGIE
jgi:hypothetical protein